MGSEIYWFDGLGQLGATEVESWGLLLPPADQARLVAMTSMKRAREFVVGRRLAALALECFTGLRQFPVSIDGAKPVANGCHLSISHSGDYVVVAVSQVPCGVDVEVPKPRDILAICKEFFHVEEFTTFSALGEADKANYFFSLWTLKEAQAKCLERDFVSLLSQESEKSLVTHRLFAASTKLSSAHLSFVSSDPQLPSLIRATLCGGELELQRSSAADFQSTIYPDIKTVLAER